MEFLLQRIILKNDKIGFLLMLRPLSKSLSQILCSWSPRKREMAVIQYSKASTHSSENLEMHVIILVLIPESDWGENSRLWLRFEDFPSKRRIARYFYRIKKVELSFLGGFDPIFGLLNLGRSKHGKWAMQETVKRSLVGRSFCLNEIVGWCYAGSMLAYAQSRRRISWLRELVLGMRAQSDFFILRWHLMP